MKMSTTGQEVKPRFGVIQAVTIAICAALVGVTAILSSFVTFIPGLSFFYIPLMLEPLFGSWFGPWGVIGSYIGGFIYQPFYGISPVYGFIIGLSDAYPAFMTYIGFKAFKADPTLKSKKDWAVAFVFGSIPSLIPGALLYNLTLVPVGWYTVEWAYGAGWLLVSIQQIIANFPWYLILQKTLSGFVTRSALYVKGWI